MRSFEDIQQSKLSSFLPLELNKAIINSKFKFSLIDQYSKHVSSADELIEETFPCNEADGYKPGYLLLEPNTLCVVALKDSVVIGCITATFDADKISVNVHSLAIDSQYRNMKLGSMLLLSLHSICLATNVTYMSLISSENGKILYKSFAFKEMAMNSFETTIPFKQDILAKKISDIAKLHTQKDKPKNNKRPAQLAFFNKMPTEKGENSRKVKRIKKQHL